MNGDFEISLAMSGGGFRATLFHLGVVKRLFELGLFSHLRTISSVSGGSILNGLLGIHYDALNSINDFKAHIELPTIRFARINLRNRVLIQNFKEIIPGARSSSEHFVKLLDRHLYHGKTLDSLTENVRILLNATNLNSATRWRFERKDFGDYKTGYCYSADSFPLSRAVAASTEFPGLFSPLKIKTHKYRFHYRDKNKRDIGENRTPPPVIYLADGGIYDNTGYYALLHELKGRPERFVIISDASGYFDESGRKYGYLSQITRTLWIALERLNNITKKRVFDELKSGKLRGLYFTLKESCRHYREIEGGSSELPDSLGWKDGDIELLNRLRTDLDHFNEIETDYLIYHGASLLDLSFRKWYSNIYHACPQVPLNKPSHPADRVKQVLEASSRHIRVW